MLTRTSYIAAFACLLAACATEPAEQPAELATVEQAAVSPEGRGVWMHYHTGSAYGTGEIIGNASLESLAHTRLSNWDVHRVYGGYRDLPVTDAADIAAWNASLFAAGIQSQLLLGGPHHIFPGTDCRGQLLEHIDERLIDFHDNGGSPRPLAERFLALHLDVEPQAFSPAAFGTGGPPACAPTSEYWAVTSSRATLFGYLYDTYVDVRAHLDGAGYADLPLYVDLPGGGYSSTSFDGADTPDFTAGIDWMAQVGALVTGITYMTYARDNAPQIRLDVLDERLVLLDSTEARVSVNAKERFPWSSLLTWTSLGALWDVVEDLEDGSGLYAYDVDLHNYRYMASPWLAVAAHLPSHVTSRLLARARAYAEAHAERREWRRARRQAVVRR